jgi:hypothetical protein
MYMICRKQSSTCRAGAAEEGVAGFLNMTVKNLILGRKSGFLPDVADAEPVTFALCRTEGVDILTTFAPCPECSAISTY